MTNIWVLFAVIMFFMFGVIYENNKKDEVVFDISDMEIVENFTRDILYEITGDSLLDIDVTYIGETDDFSIFRGYVDSLPNGLKSFEIKIGLSDVNRGLYILGN